MSEQQPIHPLAQYEALQQLLKESLQQATATSAEALQNALEEDDFARDAIEGLQQMPNVPHIEATVEGLNAQLTKQLQKQQPKKANRKVMPLRWLLLSVGVVLLICILGYAVVHLLLRR